MVTRASEKRKTSEYSLVAVHRLARNRHVIYSTQKVENDIENLRYSLDAVCECLQSLGPQHYHESIRYHNQQSWFDVYKCNWLAPSLPGPDVSDQLYIKLKLNKDCTYVILASFHI